MKAKKNWKKFKLIHFWNNILNIQTIENNHIMDQYQNFSHTKKEIKYFNNIKMFINDSMYQKSTDLLIHNVDIGTLI